MNTWGLHTCLIPKENLPWLESWIVWLLKLGASCIILQDNSKVGTYTTERYKCRGMVPGRINKYGMNYDYMVHHDKEEARQILRRIVDKYPQVTLMEWSPLDPKSGVVLHAQEEARNVAMRMLKGRGIKWGVNLDADEYLMYHEGDFGDWLSALPADVAGAYLTQKPFESRFDNLGKHVWEICTHYSLQYPRGHDWHGQKYCYRIDGTKRLGIHDFQSKGGRKLWSDLFFQHYNRSRLRGGKQQQNVIQSFGKSEEWLREQSKNFVTVRTRPMPARDVDGVYYVTRTGTTDKVLNCVMRVVEYGTPVVTVCTHINRENCIRILQAAGKWQKMLIVFDDFTVAADQVFVEPKNMYSATKKVSQLQFSSVWRTTGVCCGSPFLI